MRPTTRLVLVLLGIFAAACADISSPTRPPFKASEPQFDIIDSSMCRSGYNIANGRCND
jgi:hypothetical protein